MSIMKFNYKKNRANQKQEVAKHNAEFAKKQATAEVFDHRQNRRCKLTQEERERRAAGRTGVAPHVGGWWLSKNQFVKEMMRFARAKTQKSI